MFDTTKAFSGFAVDDLDAANQFYGETLGIEVRTEDMGILTLRLSGDRVIVIYPKPDFTPATYTILNFPVDDIDAAVDDLTCRGVELTRYDGFDHDGKGVVRDPGGPQIAWFTDPAGNILSVLQDQ